MWDQIVVSWEWIAVSRELRRVWRAGLVFWWHGCVYSQIKIACLWESFFVAILDLINITAGEKFGVRVRL